MKAIDWLVLAAAFAVLHLGKLPLFLTLAVACLLILFFRIIAGEKLP